MRPDWDIDMMILTRKIGECIVINQDIRITMLGMHENNIRLGINKPKSISMQENEIHLNMKKEEDKSDSGKNNSRINNIKNHKVIN